MINIQAKLLEVAETRRKAQESIATLKDSLQQLNGYEMCLNDIDALQKAEAAKATPDAVV